MKKIIHTKTNKDIPCDGCITLASCKTKDTLKCSILSDWVYHEYRKNKYNNKIFDQRIDLISSFFEYKLYFVGTWFDSRGELCIILKTENYIF